MLAPEKGSITRDQISQKGEDYLDNLKTKFQNFLSTTTNELEDIKSETEDLLAKGKEKLIKQKTG